MAKKTKKEKKRINLGAKTLVAVILFAIGIFTVSVIMGALRYTKALLNNMAEKDYRLARTIAITVDQDAASKAYNDVYEIYKSIPEDIKKDPLSKEYMSYFDVVYNDPVYIKLREALVWDVETNDIDYASMAISIPEDKCLLFVMDSDILSDGKYYPGYYKAWSEEEIKRYKETGNPYISYKSYEILTTDGHEMFKVGAPFYDINTKEEIGRVIISEKIDRIYKKRNSFVVGYAVNMLLITIIMAVFAVTFMRKCIIRPIKSLTKAADQYSADNNKKAKTAYFQDLNINSNDEIQTLGESIAGMEREVHDYIDNLTYMTAENQRISTEIDVAARIQSTMLPTTLKGYHGVDNFHISASMKPARDVGGDFYDYFMIDDDNIGMVIADVSGKGFPAALFMVVSKVKIKNSIFLERDASKLVHIINDQLCEDNEENMFVTAWFGIYTISTKKLVTVNAGHEYPMIYRASEGKYSMDVEEHDVPLGLLDGMDFASKEIQLYPGDRLFIYTDGIAEASRVDDTMYGTERLEKCLNENVDVHGDDLLHKVTEDVLNFVQGAPQFDDMTMLIFEIDK